MPDSIPPALGHPSVVAHLTDVHCHPTDTVISPGIMDAVPIRLCAMATRQSDQRLVRDLARAYPDKVVPCFGYHPWFTHWISLNDTPPPKEDHYRSLFLSGAPPKPGKSEIDNTDAFRKLLPYLPDPVALPVVLADLSADLAAFPNAMIGEVGLDRAARVPYYAIPSEPPYLEPNMRWDLSPFTIPLPHQLAILEAQLDLAVQLHRNVSLHSVKSQQATAELFARMHAKHGAAWHQISVDLHSCGLSVETWRDLEKQHCNVFLSLSTVINSRSPAHKALIAACQPSRLLIESDYDDVRLCASQTWGMLLTVAEVKGWHVEETWFEGELPETEWGAVKRLEENWKRFEKGGHMPSVKKKVTRDSAKQKSKGEAVA